MTRRLLEASGLHDLPELVWDPTPSAPDLFRDKLFLTLAEEPEEQRLSIDQLRSPPDSCLDSQSPANDGQAASILPSTDTGDRISSYERKQELNRQAQKRFRNRQKVKPQLLISPTAQPLE